MTPRQIERWNPRGLHEVAGCHALKSHFQQLLISSEIGGNLLVLGESRTGKGGTIRSFVRSLMCGDRDPANAVPCGRCPQCRNFDVRKDEMGLFSCGHRRVLQGNREPVNFLPINCGDVTESELRTHLRALEECQGLRLVFLDEVHRLQRRKMDHSLLVPLQDLDAMWIAATAEVSGLEPMFLNRFSVKIATELPTPTELGQFLLQRCDEFGLRVDTPETLQLLVKRSRRIVGQALHVLATAAGHSDRTVTRDLVANFVFFVEGL